jgi:hypothetical protein
VCPSLMRHGVLVGVVGGFAFAAVLAATIPAKSWAGENWTVVTMARDGSWGAGTASSLGQAISAAIRDCRAMAVAPSDCGAQVATTRDGWALASLCGDRKIITVASNLKEAEAAARKRETDLRLYYAPGLPPCQRVLAVEPGGVVSTFSVRNSPPDESKPQME